MKERVQKLLGKKVSSKMNLSTFHSLGLQILKEDIHHLGYSKQFAIYDTSDQLSILRELLKRYKAGKNFHLRTLQAQISQLKNRGIEPQDFIKSPYFDPENDYDMLMEYLYPEYQKKLEYYNAVDFDDILALTLKLLSQFPEITRKYSQKFKYITIDEYQDTNDLQFKLVRYLTSTHNNLCVVGDDDQAIYAFRGANIENILSFEKNFPQAKVVKLEQNYRSTTPILELANEVISQSPKRKEKKLWSKNHSEEKPFLWASADEDHEAVVICEEINHLQNKGFLLNDMAILYRSNTQVPILEDQLRLYNIPYKIIGGQKLYEKKEIKDIIAYLSLIRNTYNEVALRRILNVPNRGIGLTSLKQMLEIASQKSESLFQTLTTQGAGGHKRAEHFKSFTQLILKYKNIFKGETLSRSIQKLLEEIKYKDYLQKYYTHQEKVIKLKENDLSFFIESAKRFESHFGKEATLENFLDKLLLSDSQDEQKKEEYESTPITLMTYHSSKGLEFDMVFMMGVEEEILPHKKAIAEGEDISEECRLAYVGITRARKKLFMTYAKERNIYGKKTPRHVSRFLKNADESFYTFHDKTTFDHMTEEEEEDYKKNFFSNLMGILED